MQTKNSNMDVKQENTRGYNKNSDQKNKMKLCSKTSFEKDQDLQKVKQGHLVVVGSLWLSFFPMKDILFIAIITV